MPKYRGTATWEERCEHGYQRVTLEVTTEAPSQAQANAEAHARLWRRMGGADSENPMYVALRGVWRGKLDAPAEEVIRRGRE